MRKTLHTDKGRRLASMIRQARESKGLTMRELADRLERPHTVIAKIESGERRVDLVELEAICEALGVSLVNFVRRYRDEGDGAETTRSDGLTDQGSG